MKRNERQRRRGAVGVLTAVLLIPLVAMVACAVDLGYIWRTDAELQNAADAAALAGAAALLEPSVKAGSQPPLSSTQRAELRASASALAVQQAVEYGEYHRGGDLQLVVQASDVTVGYIADATAAESTPEGRLQTEASAPFPNAVCVVVRRDDSVATGPLQLFFARALGVDTINRTARATAVLRGGKVTGFQGANPYMLPIAMQLETYRWLTRQSLTPPEGLVAQDLFGVDLTITHPVQPWPDGVYEAKIFPDMPSGTTPSVMGTVSLDQHVSNPGASDLSRWIREGMSDDDAGSWNSVTSERGLYATPAEPLWMDVKTGINASMKDDLSDIIGRPAIMPVFDQTNNQNGSNAQFRVVGFVGVVIVDVQLTGSMASKHIMVQLNGAVTDSATVADANSGTVNNSYVFKGVSLVR